MPNKTTYLKDYQKPPFSIDKVDLSIDLFDDHALVTNEMQISKIDDGPLRLNGDELELISLSLNQKQLKATDYEKEGDDILISQCPDKFTLIVVTRIYPQKNTALSGLYRSHQLFCTQCEAEGFRRITYYPDRPDVLSIFTTRITADRRQYPVLLSNGNLLGEGDVGEGRHYAIWHDPFKKPAYLFALVAGQLKCVKDEYITQSNRRVDLRIYVESGNETKCDHAMSSLKRSMKWDEDVYGLEYDLDIFMIVAVSDFNMGAMENKGLNIFNSKYILAKPSTATDDDFAFIEGVVGHEYFHNWTGNRVTCRDWFQLSLKEGLTVFRDQEFSRDMNSREVNRIKDVRTLLQAQFPEDAGSMAHPVRPESYQEINNFYTATVYNKGAEVIRMQHTILGAEGFRKGMDLYFMRHDGQAVTIDDFVSAMEDANDVDLSKQFKRWYSQAGTPQVDVSTSYTKGTLTINMSQSCSVLTNDKPALPFHIPIKIAMFTPSGQSIPLEKEIMELTEANQSFRFEGFEEKPVVSLLGDFSAPVQLNHTLLTDERLAILKYETNGYAKWNAAQTLAIECMHQWLKLPAKDWVIPHALLHAYQSILVDETYDLQLRSEVLAPPSFQEVVALLSGVDVGLIEQIRDTFRQKLGEHLYSDAEAMYRQLWELESHQIDAEGYGRRSLRNRCLWFMMKSHEDKSLALAQEQFAESKTMTDQLASFSLLVNTNEAIREKVVDTFYQQWSGDDLVLDKWFTVQALCESPSTIDSVKNLLEHHDFNIKNPNKVRSLIGAFCMSNYRNFHALDDSGYQFLRASCLMLDVINPQVAARLITPFTRWKKLDKPRQDLIINHLNILSKEKLSKDLAELVEKSLPQ